MMLNGKTVGLMMEPTLVPYGRNRALYSCELSLLWQKLWKKQGEQILHSGVQTISSSRKLTREGTVNFLHSDCAGTMLPFPNSSTTLVWTNRNRTDTTYWQCLLTPKCRNDCKTSEREERSIISEIGEFWSCASKQLTRSCTRPNHLLSKPPAKAEEKNFTFVTILSKACVKVFVFNSKTRHQDWVWSELTGAGKPTSICSIKVSF
jgi:hypothetical protein